MRGAWLALLVCVWSEPQLSFPFNNQLPPVARYGENYAYTISGDTFTSDSGEGLSYSASDLPDWLTLSGRTLSGTPSGQGGDTTVTFSIQASDSQGQASDNCTLQLTSTKDAGTSESVQQVLSASGEISSADSFVLQPNKQFELKFPNNFFNSDGRTVVGHYAVTADHAPLPIWLSFDGETGTFSGTAPSVNSDIAKAQSFDILYIQSTYAGFETSGVKFSLVLGANTLSVDFSTDTVNATVGEWLEYDIPLHNVTLNSKPLEPGNLSNAEAAIPQGGGWLTFHQSNYTLTGVPSEEGQTLVNITLTDNYQDTVSFQALFEAKSENDTVFSTSSLPSINATRGGFLNYDLEQYIMRDVDISIEGADWLSYDSENKTVLGDVPTDFNSTVIKLTASTSSDSNTRKRADNGDQGNVATISIYAQDPVQTSSTRTTSSYSTSRSSSVPFSSSISASGTKSSSATRTRASSTSTSPSKSSATNSSATASSTLAASAANNSKSNKTSKKSVAIGCGVGIPLGIIAVALLLLFLWWARRRRLQEEKATTGGSGPGGGSPGTASDRAVSAPRPTSKGVFVTPVFRTASGTAADDASSDQTVFGDTKEVEPKNGANNSPQRQSTLNFLQMDDNSSSNLQSTPPPNQGEMDEKTLTDIMPINNRSDTDLLPPGEADDNLGDIPRESWQHSNVGDRRWQDQRISYSSLASIVPTEPPTVQPTSQEFPEGPESNMQRDASSGILHRMGSHSSSAYAQHAVRDASFTQFRRQSQNSDHAYRTASSGEEESSSLSDDVDLRPYRDEQGGVRWAGSSVNQQDVTRKPSQVGHRPPSGHKGELAFI